MKQKFIINIYKLLRNSIITNRSSADGPASGTLISSLCKSCGAFSKPCGPCGSPIGPPPNAPSGPASAPNDGIG